MDAVNGVPASVSNISSANPALGVSNAEQIFGKYLTDLSSEIQGTASVPPLSAPLSAMDIRSLLQQLVSDQLISDIERGIAASAGASAMSAGTKAGASETAANTNNIPAPGTTVSALV